MPLPAQRRAREARLGASGETAGDGDADIGGAGTEAHAEAGASGARG
ncbi:hypothetical protein [Rubricoccus marinus]|nr:hypothetical protein [Rubricoccus marinus]